MAQASNITRRPSLAKKVMARSGIHIKSSHKGRLHKNLKVPEGQEIPLSKLKAAKHSKSASVRKQANFALNARHWS